MLATTATFWSLTALIVRRETLRGTGLVRTADRAAMCSTARTGPWPPQLWRLPRQVPLSGLKGAPRSDAAGTGALARRVAAGGGLVGCAGGGRRGTRRAHVSASGWAPFGKPGPPGRGSDPPPATPRH